MPAPSAINRALVVDDDDLVLTATASLLEDLGYYVLTEATPQNAVEHIRANEGIGLLVCDYRMPSMSGADVVNSALSERADLAVIIATGYPFEAGDLAGRAVVLRKPYGKTDLMAAIAEAAAQGRTRGKRRDG
jgi:CheY-like chemotaxis protein